jgi:PhzF family phenazine biosynthesis protein
MTKPDTAVIPFYQVDAFTTQPFGGNPAGVCPLTEWLPDDVLQAIATENNLSETAFCAGRGRVSTALVYACG